MVDWTISKRVAKAGSVGLQTAVAIVVAVVTMLSVSGPAAATPVVPSSANASASAIGFDSEAAVIDGHSVQIEVAYLIPTGSSAAGTGQAALTNASVVNAAKPAAKPIPTFPAVPPPAWPQFFDADPNNDVVDVSYNPANATVNAEGAIINAANTWNAVAGSRYHLVYDGTTDTQAPGINFDRLNHVSWPSTWDYSPTTLAVTETIFDDRTGDILDTDMVLQPNSFIWSGPNPFSINSVVLHEFGHFAGLIAHSTDPTQVMYSTISAGQERLTLGTEDQARLVALYPEKSFGSSAVAITTHRIFAGTAATFTDFPQLAPSSYTASITWGDGASTPATLIPRARGGYDITGTHTYAKNGKFTINTFVSRPGASAVTATFINVSGTGATTCAGSVANSTLAGDVQIAAGQSCRLIDVAVGHDLAAPSGTSLEMRGGSVGNDINATEAQVVVGPDANGNVPHIVRDVNTTKAALIEIDAANIGRDATFAKTMSGRPSSGLNVICRTSIGRDLIINGTTNTGFYVGIGFPLCGPGTGLMVGRDAQLTNNTDVASGTTFDFTGNSISRNLTCNKNTPVPGGTSASNTVGKITTAQCKPLVAGAVPGP